MRIMMTTPVTKTTDMLATITASVLGVLSVEVGRTTLVEVAMLTLVNTGLLIALILTERSGLDVTIATPVVTVALCLLGILSVEVGRTTLVEVGMIRLVNEGTVPVVEA